MVFLNELIFYASKLLEGLHFYFKPGLWYQSYPGTLGPSKNKYAQILLKYIPAARKGIRQVWYTYSQMTDERDIDIDKFKLLLTEVENMQNTLRNGGHHHISMSKSEEELSLKKLAMCLYHEIGKLNEYNQDYEEALDNYDRSARMLYNERADSRLWKRSSGEVQDKLYRTIRRFLAARDEKIQHDVLLVNIGVATASIPWSIMALGTHLVKNGKKVRLMDEYACEEYGLLREATHARLIGFSVMTPLVGISLKLSRQIKKLYPDKFIVWGGVHPTLFPEQCLEEDSIDFVVVGEGEEALMQLATCLENKDYNFHEIPSLGFKDNGTPVINPMGKPFRFEDAGPWQYELLDVKNYLNCSKLLIDFKYPSISFLATKGCPKGCAFCINSIGKYAKKYYTRPVEFILDEIEQLIRKYHARTIVFADDGLFSNPNYFASIVEGIMKRNLKFEWGGTAAISDVLRNKDLILNAKEAGLFWLSSSGESGSNRLLKLLNKGITVEDTLECMHFYADNDLMLGSGFMTHLPTETPQERKATLDLMEHIENIFREKNIPCLTGAQVFRPYPGSKLYNMYVESGWKPPETLEEWGR